MINRYFCILKYLCYSIDMQKLLIRHGEQMNGGKYGSEGPPLTVASYAGAVLLGEDLREKGFDTISVATSPRLRARQTASRIGALEVVVNPLLDGTCSEDPADRFALAKKLFEGQVPDETLEAIERLREDPPKEKILVTHAEIIAGCKAISMQEQGIDPTGHNLLVDNLHYEFFDLQLNRL